MAEKNKSWYQKINDNADELVRVAVYLERKANAFRQVGNDQMATELIHKSDVVAGIAVEIKEIVHKQVGEEYKRAEQASINVLSGVMAGMEIGKKGNNNG